MGIQLRDLPLAAQEQVRRKLAAQAPAGAENAGEAGPKGTGLSGGKLSDLEMLFDAHLKTHAPDMERPVAEYRFAKAQGREYRFDRCWPARMLAVELDGGVHTGGRHVRGSGFTEDCRKLNLAVSLGWRVLRFTSEMMVKDPLGCLAQLRDVLEDGKECSQAL